MSHASELRFKRLSLHFDVFVPAMMAFEFLQQHAWEGSRQYISATV